METRTDLPLVEIDRKNPTFERKVGSSLRWSALAEIAGKLLTPLMTMILARILAQEIFGIVASINVIIMFAEIFADAGFARFLVQKDFENKGDKEKYTQVAFYSSMAIALTLFAIIVIFRHQLAIFVAADGYGDLLAVAAIQIPIYGFNGIQIALLRRSFKFKELFFIRLAAVIVPMVISIPMALLNFGVWSIVTGTLAGVALQAITIVFFTKWRPRLFFKAYYFKSMFRYSSENLLEAILVWLNITIDVLIIGRFFDLTTVGVYRTVVLTETGIITMFVAIFMPVLFSTLSRLKDDQKRFSDFFFAFQKNFAYLLIPFAVGLFLYRDLVILVMFGSGWGSDASHVLGVFAITSIATVLISNFASTIYFAKGKPIYSVFAQILYLIAILIVDFTFARIGFNQFVIARGSVMLILSIMACIFLPTVFKISLRRILANFVRPLLLTAVMAAVAIGLTYFYKNIYWQFATIFIAMAVYFACFYLMFRKDFKSFLGFVFKRRIIDEDTPNVSDTEATSINDSK